MFTLHVLPHVARACLMLDTYTREAAKAQG